jgi:coenzyme F420 hydrogenase subunit beta
VNESERRIFGRLRSPSERWTGIMRNVYLAGANHEEVYTAASAGGAVTALLISALRAGVVDACLIIGRDTERSWVPVPRLASTVEAVIAGAQANYCITPNLQILRDAPFERIAVVGLPCQIQAVNKVRNLADPPELIRPVTFTVEIACASNTRREGTEHLIQNRLNLPLTDVRRMRYRDGEYPGEFTVWNSAGERQSLPFHELVTEFKKFKTFRCLSCPDWWSGLADISVADGDPNIFKTSRSGLPTEKSSLVVTRTERGDELLDLAADTGHLTLTKGEFIPEESLGLQRKRHRYAHYRDGHPGSVPAGPANEETLAQPLSDDEVIERMSMKA